MIVQIFILNQNLHIIFGQERINCDFIKLAKIRKLISEALHKKSSHLVKVLHSLILVKHFRFHLEMISFWHLNPSWPFKILL